MPPRIRTAIGTLALTLGLTAGAEPPRPDHPLVGAWTFSLPDGSCSETYRFLPDGTSVTTSGEEIGESKYGVSAEPSAKGFYKLTDTVTKANGKNDCGGSVTPVGKETTNFIRFDDAEERMIICRNESLEMCFGPLRRVRGQAV